MSISDLTTVSIAYGLLIASVSAWELFRVFRTNLEGCCFVFYVPLIALLLVSFARTNSDKQGASVPIRVNLATLILLTGVLVFRSYWDLEFILYGKEYASILEEVIENDNSSSEEEISRIQLPEQYTHLAIDGEIYIARDGENKALLAVFPATPWDLDNLFGAFVYTLGFQSTSLPHVCLSGRPVNPFYENWYYCTVSLNRVKSER